MSSLHSARRRRALLLASAISAPSLYAVAAQAQQAPAPDQLPAIEVTKPSDQNVTRARPTADGTLAPARSAPGTTRTSNTGTGTGSNTTSTGTGTGTGGTGGGRQFAGIVGTSSTVITADDIAHSPVQTLPEILAQVPGVQLQSLYGGLNGAKTSVDLRGFGAFASDNVLFLLNGRRLNDVDKAGFDITTIPLDSIERIEIIRGNSGAVLYGDNAEGGVINIITKTGVGGPPVSIKAEAGYGSFNQRMAAVSAAVNSGPWSTSFYGNGIKSDGYRANNALDQRNAVGNINYTTSDLTAFLSVTGSDQKLGFPGGRLVDPSIGLNELATDRRGTDTPYDCGNQQTASVTAGFTRTLINGVDLIVDGGWRQRDTQSAFFGTVPTISFASTYNDAALQTWSLTPRLSIKNVMLGMPSTILTGVDYYDSAFRESRGAYAGVDPYHIYNIGQQTLAGYWQQTIGLLSSTDLSYGARAQNTSVSARDHYDPNAPFAFDTRATPLNSNETQYALHLGVEHRFNDTFSVFAGAARAFRTPDVDERVASGPSFDPVSFAPIPQNFQLKTQTSEDVEGGIRVKTNRFQVQTSVYLMDLDNEIHYNPVLFYNVNLDPTRRYGSETSASLKVSDTVTFRAGMAYTRAIFRDGIWAGNDIPLVSRYTGNLGVTWNIWQNYLVFDATLRAWSSRVMDNDQANTQGRIPGNATADIKLSGQYDRYFWSLSVNNLFNALYYDYAIASSFTAGRFSAYPLPGRTYMVKAGATF